MEAVHARASESETDETQLKLAAILASFLLLLGTIAAFTLMRSDRGADNVPTASLAELREVAEQVRVLKERQLELKERVTQIEPLPPPRPTATPVDAATLETSADESDATIVEASDVDPKG